MFKIGQSYTKYKKIHIIMPGVVNKVNVDGKKMVVKQRNEPSTSRYHDFRGNLPTNPVIITPKVRSKSKVGL